MLNRRDVAVNMKKMVGKVINFEAVVGVSAPSSCGTKVMVCLEDVLTSNGLFRDHCWVERKDGYPKKGTKVQFHSKVRNYFSHFEGLNQINKIGLSKIKEFKEKEIK